MTTRAPVLIALLVVAFGTLSLVLILSRPPGDDVRHCVCGKDASEEAFFRGAVGEGGGHEPHVVDISRGSKGKEIRISVLILRGDSLLTPVLVSRDGGLRWTEDPNYDYQLRWHLSPSNPRIIYDDSTGLLRRSADGGQHWVEPVLRINGLDRREFARSVTGVDNSDVGLWLRAIHPTNPDTVFATFWAHGRREQASSKGIRVGVPGIYVSYDGGSSWSLFSGKLSNNPPLGISPVDPRRMIARAPEGLVRTMDGGKTWQPVGQQQDLERRARSKHREKLMADYARRGIEIENKDPEGMKLGAKDIRFSPHELRLVFLVTNKGLYRSTDGGDTWCLLDVGDQTLGAVDYLAFDPDNPDTIYVGTAKELVVSKDRGCHFQRIFGWEDLLNVLPWVKEVANPSISR